MKAARNFLGSRAVKFLPLRVLALALVLVGPAAARKTMAVNPSPLPSATPAARDVMRRAIEPVIDAFSRHPDGPNRALTLHWRVSEATAQPPELRGTRLTLVCETPDKYLFQFLALGTVCTVCRQGQQVWVAPADKFAPLLKQAEQTPPTRADREPLEPIRLTIPTKLFWVLFYLLPVQDAGNGTIDGTACRRVEFHPPEARKGQSMRLWISGGDIRRIDLLDPDSHATLDVEDERLTPSVPAGSYELPDASQKDTVLPVPVERFRAVMALLTKEEEKRRKEFIHDHPLPAITARPPAS